MNATRLTNANRISRVAAVAVVSASAMLGTTIAAAPASADPCPDVEVVFARGTGEPAGVGGVGQAFVDVLRQQAGTRSVGVYPVNYAASSDFDNRPAFAKTVVDGISDANAHVQSTAANCPDTRLVLGGYSQGAVVAGFLTSGQIPPGVPESSVPAPMPAAVAEHVAAVTLLGKPSEQFMRQYGAPPVAIGPLYAPKTIELCAPGDTICEPVDNGRATIAHALYPVNGMIGQAAAFAAGLL